jgi:ribosomal peptide maturation radical SAM protein 1
MSSVLLVCAPFLSVVRPALGLSLLKAALLDSGVDATVEYLNLRFAETVGVDVHESLAQSLVNTLLVGEWIFSERINRRPDPEMEAEYRRALGEVYPEPVIAKLLTVRQAATAFVEQEAQRIAAAAPRILGFSTSFQQNCASLAIAERVRELRPEILICFGGANCEGPMGRALIEAFPQIDYVFSGEADRTFPEFVRRVLTGTPPYAPSPDVYSRQGETAGGGAAPSHPAHPVNTAGMVRDLDALPLPDFADYFAALGSAGFRERIVPGLIVESSRGCWWGARKHCRFCGLNGSTMSYRSKSPGQVVRELRELHRTWDVEQFLAVDNIMDMQHIESVFGTLGREESRYRFFYEIKANLTRPQLETIAAGGVTWIQPGIESLDDDTLREMEKGVTALQNLALLRNAAEIGLRVLWSILVGFPGETAERYSRMAEWIPKIEHLEPPFGCVPIRLDRFSPYFERAAELGFERVRPVFAYGPVYGLPPAVLERLAYFFEGERRAPDPDSGAFERLCQTAEDWRRRSGERGGPPVLALSSFDSGGLGGLIEDTRSSAGQRWRVLSAEEKAVLAACREPQPVRAVLQRAGGEHPEEAFERLVAAGYVLVQRERALSLVVDEDAGDGVRLAPSPFPGGWVRPPAAA